jgi:hypothetical protein
MMISYFYPYHVVLIWEWRELPMSHIPLSLGLIVDAAQLKVDGMKGGHWVPLVHSPLPPPHPPTANTVRVMLGFTNSKSLTK